MNSVSLPHLFRAPLPGASALRNSPERISFLDRVAAWADRQPRHHRLGSWTALGIHLRR